MGLLKCLSPRSHSMKEKELRSELRQVKAQLAEAKITIADLKQGAVLASDERISSCPSPPKVCLDVAVQAKPPVECESRIPRPDESAASKSSAGGVKAGRGTPQVSITDVATGTQATAGGAAVPVSPGSLRNPGAPAGLKSPSGRMTSPTRGIAVRSRIPASPSPDFIRRSQSCKAASAGNTAAAAAAAAAAVAEAEDGEASAGALAASSNQAHADFLTNQFKVAEAFRQSLEVELREARYKNSALQTQVLTLQTKLEKSMEEQVDEIGRLEVLRKHAGSVDSKGYEDALAELSQLKRRLEGSEADRAVAEQQAQAATDLATSSKETLSATQSELACVKSDLAAAQAKLLELTAEGAGLKQQLLKLSKAQQRADELEVALVAARSAAAATEAEYKDRVSKLEEELRTQKAISESTCEELLALSATHSELKQCYHKMECESKQHDQLVHIVQQELAEMSYFAAAGRVALGLCNPQDAPIVTGAVVVTPSHSGCASPQLVTASHTLAPPASHFAQQDDPPAPEQQSSRSSKLVEDTTAVCIAAAAAAGAAAAIAANPGSPSSPRVTAATMPPAAAASEVGSSSNNTGSSSSSNTSSRVVASSPRLFNRRSASPEHVAAAGGAPINQPTKQADAAGVVAHPGDKAAASGAGHHQQHQQQQQSCSVVSAANPPCNSSGPATDSAVVLTAGSTAAEAATAAAVTTATVHGDDGDDDEAGEGTVVSSSPTVPVSPEGSLDPGGLMSPEPSSSNGGKKDKRRRRKKKGDKKKQEQ